MTAWLLDHAPYTPFMEPRTAHPPGLSPLDPAEWLTVDPDFTAQMAYRATLLRDRPEVVLAALPGTEAAIAELYEVALRHLRGRADYRFDGPIVTRPDGAQVTCDPTRPLETLGALIAEDLCVLTPDATSGEYMLRAALLCFPSRWLLSEKIGRPLTPIHDPVPEYDATLARRVNRVFDVLHPDRPLVRVNWLVHASAELHLPLGLSDKEMAQAKPEQGVYLRTERQTLTRLPKTEAVIFGIKTSLCEIAHLTPAQALVLRREFAAKYADDIAYDDPLSLEMVALTRLQAIAEGTDGHREQTRR